ncbi:MAG: ATP-binding cassette domain-containing protein, partial [Anaerolineales bacterium]|nr:ATP-binding cassette domain-containing protein [Anaerolineales bacterium]
RARYGIHLMYADNSLVEGNQFLNNAVGIYTMYSRGVRLVGNEMRGQRGPSGYALGFKDADDVEVAGNWLIDNRAGLFIDAAPFSPQGTARFHDNVLAFNDVGVIMLTSTRRAELTDNTFWENVEQVAIQGGGDVSAANLWRNNYWSDYTGFDLAGDGFGDTPYRAERFFEGLTDREPMLRALLYSPAAQALEFAGAALPMFRPQPKLVDVAPRLQPAAAPALVIRPASTAGMLWAALGLLLLSGAVLGLAAVRGDVRMPATVVTGPADAAAPVLEVAGATKRYGRAAALEAVSFAAQRGEALALWGANGAGKTTLIKAILGLIEFDGQITIQGQNVRRAGKAARRAVGYVPQDVAFYEQSVAATLAFYARLKAAPAARIPALLERLGLAAHAHKPVAALSGGLRQRLALAVALLADPPVLLLDEPTANLDAQAQRDYLALLAGLCRDEHKTILFASHRLEEVELLAHRVLMLEHGRLVDTVTPAELLARLMPFVQLTLWVPEAQRPEALARFTGAGFNAHLNGRGTVVVQVRAEEKLRLLRMLETLPVVDFEMERGAQWK